jgi:hypothetical protein
MNHLLLFTLAIPVSSQNTGVTDALSQETVE